MKRLQCSKCNHQWIPRTDDLPATCPRCKSYSWNNETEVEDEARLDTKSQVPNFQNLHSLSLDDKSNERR